MFTYCRPTYISFHGIGDVYTSNILIAIDTLNLMLHIESIIFKVVSYYYPLDEGQSPGLMKQPDSVSQSLPNFQARLLHT